MNNLRNAVQLIGHLGKDAELKEFGSGRKIAKVTIATNESYRNASGEKVEEVTWHNLIGWGKTAELMQQLMKKGQQVAIQGKLKQRSYEDKNGIKRYVTEVSVTDFLMMNRSPKVAPLDVNASAEVGF
ncbi:MAG: single-stranded DNA-binding protein [Bacteroidota bacterium]